MKQFLLKVEPVIWLLFGQGIMIGTMLLTGWVLVMGVLAPLGVVDSLRYEHAHGLAARLLRRDAGDAQRESSGGGPGLDLGLRAGNALLVEQRA